MTMKDISCAAIEIIWQIKLKLDVIRLRAVDGYASDITR